MTRDDLALLKHGLFCALVVAGFWLLIVAVKNRAVAVIGVILWFVFLYWIFYRDAQNKKLG